MGAPFSLPEAAEARARHMRRQLECAADFGIDLLAALDVPRLVTAEFASTDSTAIGDAIDRAIEALDALDGPSEDLEEDDPREDDDPGEDDGTAEHTLGAPERHPYSWCSTADWFRPADGRRLVRYRSSPECSQVRWAQGLRQDGEGEGEPGYDLPEGDDERDDDGLSEGEGDPAEKEPWLSVTEFDGVGDNWHRSGAQTFEGYLNDIEICEPVDQRFRTARKPDFMEPSGRVLAATAQALKRSRASAGGSFDLPWIGGPRLFGLRVVGRCCEPHILDGGVIHVDVDAKPQAGDFVAIYFERVIAGQPTLRSWVKRLTCDIPSDMQFPHVPRAGDELVPVVIVEALNPPQQFAFDPRRVHAVLKVVEILPPAAVIAGEPTQHRATHF